MKHCTFNIKDQTNLFQKTKLLSEKVTTLSDWIIFEFLDSASLSDD